MRLALAIGAAVAVVAAVGGAGGPAAGAPARPSQGAAAAAAYDFGDAPDGAFSGYAGKRVRGKFPSRAARGGPRHPVSGPHIGTGWSAEANSRQVDADNDDGAQLNARPCAISTLSVVVDVSRADPETELYLNAWFDWNQDGDWADGGTRRCSPEWGIQNMRLDPASFGDDRIAMLTLRFRAGRVPNQFWWRVQVHSGEPVPHLGSGGQTTPTRGGETEDWFFNRLPPRRAPSPLLRCSPLYQVIPHGGSSTVYFKFVRVGDAHIGVLRVQHSDRGPVDGTGIRRRTVRPDQEWAVELRSEARHRRDPRKQEIGIRLDVDALVNGRKRDFWDSCRVVFFHVVRVTPPVKPPQELKPVQRGVEKVTPESARCRARFAPLFTFATVEVRCNGAHARTVSVRVDRAITRYTVRGTTWPGSCGLRNNNLHWYCHFRPNNKGRVIAIDYDVANTYSENVATVNIEVLAGGSDTTPGGTTFVLRQFWSIDRNRQISCRQSIPSSADCPPLYPANGQARSPNGPNLDHERHLLHSAQLAGQIKR